MLTARSAGWLSAMTAASAYVNAKFSVGIDLVQLRRDREWRSRLERRLLKAGDNCTLFGMFDTVDPGSEALWFEGRTWTYGRLKTEANRFAHVLASNGVTTGDFVALFTTNSPEMIIALLAVSRLGAVAALLNTNLRDETFAHCMDVSRAEYLISTPDLAPLITRDIRHFTLNVSSFTEARALAPNIKFIDLNDTFHVEIDHDPTPRSPADLAVLIFTSGTTGKPKACAVKNMQLFVASNPISQDTDDPGKYYPLRIYSSLPLFHGTALFAGFSYTVGSSGTLCLRRKFSASSFWKDVAESNATRMLYIGELCRYLLASPLSPYDKAHRCIVANGNGLRREIWEEFKSRFGVAEIREFYRSTEGLGRALERDTFIIRVDTDTSQPWRDLKTGLCVLAKLDEAGEVIGRVRDRGLLTEYLGNKAATEEKLIHDVLKKGDCFQRMGYLAVQESSGWVRFHDRVGDSFRWKGENVSAGEVRDLICEIRNVRDAIVFGVVLKGAAVVTLRRRTAGEEATFVQEVYRELHQKGLPSYAFPRLLRISSSIGTGVTFKHGKREESKKGWNPAAIGHADDALYWLNGTVYKKLGVESWMDIEAGRARL
ncbi:Very long-chain acyl-CoA synthetase [Lachnellula arida]|uniref:Very long-chain acyl-CoA synthetase n=1 Tax=Lachnellula arida TaxID=1316785 RepID=A0A8T9B640_9HELO|nr:Very long-chain acyl-CoA synthetase [Lachnellula arida]